VYINAGLLNNIWGVGGYVITAQDFTRGCYVITMWGVQEEQEQEQEQELNYIKKDKNI